MKEIEEELYNIHAEARRSKMETDNEDRGPGKDTNVSNLTHICTPPIGSVTSVDEGSPADRAVNV